MKPEHMTYKQITESEILNPHGLTLSGVFKRMLNRPNHSFIDLLKIPPNVPKKDRRFSKLRAARIELTKRERLNK